MTDHVDAPPELMPLEPCDCCGVLVSYRRAFLGYLPIPICRPCFFIWYDEGLVKSDEIRKRRLEVYGTAEPY